MSTRMIPTTLLPPRGGSYCVFCYGTIHNESSKLECHKMVTEVLPQPANGRFAVVEKCSLCNYASYEYTAAKAVIADYYGVADGKPHTISVTDLSESGIRATIRLRQFCRFLHAGLGTQLHRSWSVQCVLPDYLYLQGQGNDRERCRKGLAPR